VADLHLERVATASATPDFYEELARGHAGHLVLDSEEPCFES
jgi:hypothetical protein